MDVLGDFEREREACQEAHASMRRSLAGVLLRANERDARVSAFNAERQQDKAGLAKHLYELQSEAEKLSRMQHLDSERDVALLRIQLGENLRSVRSEKRAYNAEREDMMEEFNRMDSKCEEVQAVLASSLPESSLLSSWFWAPAARATISFGHPLQAFRLQACLGATR